MKKIICLFSMMIIALMTTNVRAIEIATADETVNQTGFYESTRFVAGNTITNTAEIDGLSFIAGNEITTQGIAPYALYAGNIINVKDNIKKDLFIAGNMITIESNAKIGRDLYVAGNNVAIKTNIERDLRAGGSLIDISGITIKGNAYIAAEEIIMDNETKIEGKLMYPEDSTVTGLENAKVSKVERTEAEKIVIEYNYMDMVKGFIISSIAAFITLLALLYILPKSKEKLDNVSLNASSIIKNVGIGFLVLITVPIVSIIGLFTGILTPLALILITMYIISIYIASLLVYYIVGNVITKNLIKNENQYLALAIGIVVVKLIKYIPVLGGLLSALALFYGLGLIFKYVSRKDK